MLSVVFGQDEGQESRGMPWLRQRRLMFALFGLASAAGAIASVFGRTTIGLIAAVVALVACAAVYLVVRPRR